MKKVTVTAHPETGKVFTLAVDAKGQPKLDKNGEKHGFIRVESEEANLSFAYNGKTKKRSCLIAMTEAGYNAQAHLLTNGSQHAGVIKREDSLTPWYVGQKPLANADGVVITSAGAPVYRKESFSSNVNDSDVKLASYDRIEATVKASAKTIVA